MKFFKVYSLTRLRNQEFPAAYGKIISVLENDEITVEYITQSLESVKAHKKNLVVLRNMKAPHQLTKIISDLKFKRHDAFLSLKGKVSSAMKSPIDNERKVAEILNTWLIRYHKFFSKASIHEQTSVFDEMMDEVNTKPSIQSAVNEGGVLSILDSIQSITTQIEEAYMTRNKEKVEASRKALLLKQTAYADMKMLLNSIEMAITLNEGNSTVFMGYVNEINLLMDVFKAKAQSRTTRRKNAAEEAETNQDANPENGEQEYGGNEEPQSGKPAIAGRNKPFNEVSLNDMDLHNGTTNESLDGKDAMNGSSTNNGVDHES